MAANSALPLKHHLNSSSEDKLIKTFTTFKEFEEFVQLSDYDSFFFDLDGTLVDTEELHLSSSLRAASIDLKKRDDYRDLFHGATDHDVYRALAPSRMSFSQYQEKKFKAFQKVLSEGKFRFFSEIKDFLEKLSQTAKTLALVTSSEHNEAQIILETLGLKDFFHFIVTREMTTENKPSPMPYLYALNLSQAQDKSKVLIIEDSLVGVQAAQNSGLSCVKVLWYRP